MKIAIIEDRIDRLRKFIAFDLRDYKEIEIVSGNEYNSLIYDLTTEKTEVLNKYDCIAVHGSSLTTVVRDIIKKYCNEKKKPLVFFSGAITTSVFKNIGFVFLYINSKDFYSINLKLFIDDYRSSNNFNLLILQFGNRWKLSLLLDLRSKIVVAQSKQILKNENSDIDIEDSELIKRIDDLHINPLIRNDLVNDQTENILSISNYTSISIDQIETIKSAIDHLIYKMV